MNSTYLSILLGVAALIAAGGFIIKGYNAKGVLFSIGIVLMAIAYAMGKPQAAIRSPISATISTASLKTVAARSA